MYKVSIAKTAQFHLSQTATTQLQTLKDPHFIQSCRLVFSILPEICHIWWHLVDFLLSKDVVIFFHRIVIFSIMVKCLKGTQGHACD